MVYNIKRDALQTAAGHFVVQFDVGRIIGSQAELLIAEPYGEVFCYSSIDY
jgi:hypothetical protein